MGLDGCNVMAAEGWVSMSKRISAVSGSKVTDSSSSFRRHILDWHCLFCLSMRRFVLEICVVEFRSHENVVKICDVFFAPQIRGKGPKIFGAFVDRHHFRSTDQVWLRSHVAGLSSMLTTSSKILWPCLAFSSHNYTIFHSRYLSLKAPLALDTQDVWLDEWLS